MFSCQNNSVKRNNIWVILKNPGYERMIISNYINKEALHQPTYSSILSDKHCRGDCNESNEDFKKSGYKTWNNLIILLNTRWPRPSHFMIKS